MERGRSRKVQIWHECGLEAEMDGADEEKKRT